MKVVDKLKSGIEYLQNDEIELRIRMLFFLEYAVFVACLLGSAAMLTFTDSLLVLVPNLVLTVFCLIGIIVSHVMKKPDLAAIIIVVGCDYIALPYMFFVSGGNNSGMPCWFLFGIVFTCVMLKGKTRIIMTSLSIILSCGCMLAGFYQPSLVTALDGEQSEFLDMLQSFFIVAIILCVSLMMYLAAYDKQRRMLEAKGKELKKAVDTDPLTGIPNRHAFYEDIAEFTDSPAEKNLVLVTLDINGLKTANDTFGHSAGDKLICESADILMEAFSKYGHIYRTGGDEFVCILFCEDAVAEGLDEELRYVIAKTNAANGSSISIAMGTAIWNQNRDKTFFELGKLADSYMYKDKNEFYSKSSNDRRKR